MQALRFFERVQIFALHVFNQRHRSGSLVRHIAHQHGHLLQTSQACGAEPAFTRDDFIQRLGAAGGLQSLRLCLAELAHQQRLHDALRLNAFGQFVQSAFVHVRARLVLTGDQIV